MRNNLYTNTSSIKGVVGLLVVTFAVSAVSMYTPEIVEGMKKLTKTGLKKAEELQHYGKTQYAVAERLYNGNIIDTGKRIWR